LSECGKEKGLVVDPKAVFPVCRTRDYFYFMISDCYTGEVFSGFPENKSGKWEFWMVTFCARSTLMVLQDCLPARLSNLILGFIVPDTCIKMTSDISASEAQERSGEQQSGEA
jgi:hypothetical protein